MMYMDILSFDDSKQPVAEPNKQPLPAPIDPWLVDQAAGITDIQFPATNTWSDTDGFGTLSPSMNPATNTLNDTDGFGRLSPSMEQFANSLLSSEMTLPVEDETFDVDVALDGLPTLNNDTLDAALGSLALEPQNPHPQGAKPRRRSKRLSSRSTHGMSSYPEPHTPAGLHPYPAQPDFSTPVDQSSAWSPASTTDGDYDSSEGATARVQRKRRPRVSYSTLTEDEKYQRIRDLNNEASRLYRERTKGHFMNLQEKEKKELERNRTLRAKADGLERLRDQIKAYTYSFFSEHVGNTGAQ